MNLFLIDDNIEISYKQFLEDINTHEYYFKIYKPENLYVFFRNFIIGLISDQPLILIDSDLGRSEINNFGIPEDLDTFSLTNKDKYKDFDQVLSKILESKSEITIFTSGTTGQPKKIIHNISSLTRTIRVSETNKVVWGFAYNPTHMAGLQVFFQALFNKNLIINLFNKKRELILDAIKKYQITHISATPTFYRLLLPIERSYNCVVRMTVGGEKSDTKFYEKMHQMFPNAKLNNIYASTEAGSLLVAKGENFHIPDSLVNKIKIMNNELIIHYSLLGKSFDLKLSNEFYHTNDLVEWIDETKSTFRFKSRKNELINIAGYNVNPLEVEEAISEYDNVQQVLVYGKYNSVLGNILCADVKLHKSISTSELDIRKFLKNKIQDYKVPRIIKFVENIDLTRTGKIKRL